MKFTSKKSVSEVVIDFENGSIFSIKEGGIANMSITKECYPAGTPFWNVRIQLLSGLSADFITHDEVLINDLHMLGLSK